MSRIALSRLSIAAFTVLFVPFISGRCSAAPPGVETKIVPMISGDERSRQPDIWAVDVYFKSMRMILVDIPDKKTGQTKKELVWYLPYRIVNRQIEGVVEPAGPDGKRPKFLPEFELVTDDNDGLHIHFDEVIPAAQAAINRREGMDYKNSVEIVGALPELTEAGAKLENSLYGVATWRGISPHTDFFKVFMTGFSNGYIRQGPDMINRRTIVQKYERPGDDVREVEREIKQIGTPEWIYRPSEDKKEAKPDA